MNFFSTKVVLVATTSFSKILSIFSSLMIKFTNALSLIYLDLFSFLNQLLFKVSSPNKTLSSSFFNFLYSFFLLFQLVPTNSSPSSFTKLTALSLRRINSLTFLLFFVTVARASFFSMIKIALNRFYFSSWFGSCFIINIFESFVCSI